MGTEAYTGLEFAFVIVLVTFSIGIFAYIINLIGKIMEELTIKD